MAAESPAADGGWIVPAAGKAGPLKHTLSGLCAVGSEQQQGQVFLDGCQAVPAQTWVHEETTGALHLQTLDKTMCMAVKNFAGPPVVMWTCADLKENARFSYNSTAKSLCTPGGNSSAMPPRCLVAESVATEAAAAASTEEDGDCACCCCGPPCVDVCPFCSDALQMWAKPQPDGAVAVLVVNIAGKGNLSATIDLASLRYDPVGHPTKVFDVWAQKALDPLARGATSMETPSVGPRDSVFYLLSPGPAAARPVDRHVGRWDAAPVAVPSRSPTDGPLAGNGDFGVAIGGGRRCASPYGGKSPPCAVDGGANVSTADLGLWFGKSDYWINGPVLSADTTGEPWSHGTPGFVTLSIDEPLLGSAEGMPPATPPPPAPAGNPFAATQELSNGRVNATVGIAGGQLVSSTFVARDRNLAITRVRVEASGGKTNGAVLQVATTFTLSTPNFYGIPVASGGTGGKMWLRKDACNTIKNALTLTQCSPGVLLYNSLRNVKIHSLDKSVRFLNSSLEHCIQGMPAGGNTHTPNGALAPVDEWLTAGRCDEKLDKAWRVSAGRLTDGTNCAAYSASANQWNVKVVRVKCAAPLPADMRDAWSLDADGTRLRAVKANLTGDPSNGNVLYAGGACLTAVPDNLNISVALAATVTDTRGKAVATSSDISCIEAAPPLRNSTACTLKAKLSLHEDYFIFVACLTQRDTDWQTEAVASVLELIDGVDVAAIEHTKDAYYKEFWATSSIDLAPEWDQLEGWYYGMLYLAAISFAPGKVGTSHYGSWNLADNPQCHGQLTLDYNTVACIFGMGSANRLELMKPLVDSLGRRDMYELGRARAEHANWSPGGEPVDGMVAPMGQQAAVFGCVSVGCSWSDEGGCPTNFGSFEGIEFPAAMGPFPGMACPVDAGLRFNAGLSTTMLIDYFDFTQSEEFFNATLLPFLTGVADFYSSYARPGPNNTLQFQYTCAQENCMDRDTNGGARKGMLTQDNALPDLAFARMAVMKLREYAAHGLTSAPKPSWLDLEQRLIPYPLVNRSRPDGVSGYGLGWTESMNCPGSNQSACVPITVTDGRGNEDYPIVYFAPIHPAGVVGLESDPQTLDRARATVWSVNAGTHWAPGNGLCLGWPSAGRIMGRDNGTRVLNQFQDVVTRLASPKCTSWPCETKMKNNYIASLLGGGLEQIGGIEAIHSMLLQSHESCLRFFPGWPRNSTAEFSNLRARGRFVVSAAQNANGTIGEIRVLSELGRTLSFCLPEGWASNPVVTCGGERVVPQQTSVAFRRYAVPTTAGQVCILKQQTATTPLLKTDETVPALVSLLALSPIAVRSMPVAPPAFLEFEMRNRSRAADGSWDVRTFSKRVNPKEMAILVIDPWAYHWCKTTTARGEALMPRINAGLAAGRKAGIGAVIFAPTSTSVNYLGWQQRERAVAIPRHVPSFPHAAHHADALPPGWEYTGDNKKTDYIKNNLNCMCGISSDGGCASNSGEMRMSTVLDIQPSDYIVGGWDVSELYSIFVEKGIKTVAYMGISANDCVQSKAEGMWNMQRMGIDFFLFRDTTDGETYYDDTRPYINPDNGTALIVDNMEAVMTPTTEVVAFAEAQGTVRAALGRLSALSVFLRKSILYGAFV
jgi:hypothetical protein